MLATQIQMAGMKLTNLDRDLCVQLVLHVIRLAIHHLHFGCACSVLVSPRKLSFLVKACGSRPLQMQHMLKINKKDLPNKGADQNDFQIHYALLSENLKKKRRLVHTLSPNLTRSVLETVCPHGQACMSLRIEHRQAQSFDL